MASGKPLSSVLQKLRSDGKVHSAGLFTLDPRKAREKMKNFQFQDPHHYVLALVSAGLLLGATAVDCANDSDDLSVHFDVPLPAEELRDLFACLFATQQKGDARSRALRSLALGLNAALRFEPGAVVLDSWEGSRGTRMLLEQDHEELQILDRAPWSSGAAGTRIHVKERLTWRTVQKFLQKLVGLPPEGRAIAEHCTFAPAPVWINGSNVVVPPSLGAAVGVIRIEPPEPGLRLPWPAGESPAEDPAGTLVRMRVAARGDYAAVLAVRPYVGSTVDFVVDGIRLARRQPDLGYGSACGVARCDGLRRNVSHSDIIEDETYWKLLSELRFHLKQLITRLARIWPDLPDTEKARVRPILCEAIGEKVRAAEYSERWQNYKSRLIDLPLFRTADGSPAPLRLFLRDYAERGHVLITRQQWPGAPVDGTPVLLAEPQDAVVDKVFVHRRPADGLLQEVRDSARREQDWRRRPAVEARFPHEGFLARRRLENVEGEIGLPQAEPEQHFVLTLLKEHRTLASQTSQDMAALPMGVHVIANHDELLPSPNWAAARTCPALEAVLEAARAALPALYEELASTPPVRIQEMDWKRAHILGYLQFLAARGQVYDGRLPPGLERIPFARGLDTDGGDRSLTLAQLAAIVEREGEIWSLPVDMEEAARKAPIEKPVLLLSGRDLVSLRLYFAGRVAVVIDRLRGRENRARFLAQDAVPAELPGSYPARVPLDEAEGLAGELAVGGAAPGYLDLQVLHERRPLCTVSVPLGFGPVVGIVDSSRLCPTMGFNAVVEDENWEELVRALKEKARRLSLVLAPRLREISDPAEQEPLRRFILQQLAFESGPLCDGFRQPDTTRRQLASIPLFLLAGGERLATLRELLEQPGEIGFVHLPPRVPVQPGELVVVVSRAELPLLARILGALRLTDRSEFIARLERSTAEQSRPKVETLRLPPLEYVHQIELGTTITCVIGLLPHLSFPSRVTLYRDWRLLDQIERHLPISVEAAVNDDRLKPNSQHTGVDLDENLDRVMAWLGEAVRVAVIDLLRRLEPEQEAARTYLLRLAIQLRGSERLPTGDLERELEATPLVPTMRGRFLRLAELEQRRESDGTILYMAAEEKNREELVELLDEQEDPPVIPEHEAKLLQARFGPMRPAAWELLSRRAARQNRARSGLESLTLEAHFPDHRWLVRCTCEEDGLEGELGIPIEPPTVPCVLLAAERVPLAYLDIFPRTRIVGVLDGPFQPTPGWDGLADQERSVALVRPQEVEVLAQLVHVFPEAGTRLFDRARQVLLGWSWETAIQCLTTARKGSFLDQAGDLKLFPLPEGRYTSLKTVAEVLARHGRLLICGPGERPPAGPEPIFEAAAGGDLDEFFRRIAGARLLRWRPEVIAPVIAPRPLPGHRLLEALEAEFRVLGLAHAQPQAFAMLKAVRLGRTPPGTLSWASAGGTQLLLNPEHPAVAALLDPERPAGARRLYLVMSSLYSVLNRVAAQVDDSHERWFHAQLLSSLLGGEVGGR
ncbi:MAG: hypothetical protein HY319_18055 [Armatimonadetes bacterium]|nr:hypothetical protein [Armatimonadota bacterium]